MTKVLIVDDQYEQAIVVIEALESSDLECQIYKASNAESAVKITEKIHPDIIITDWDMPDMSGIELLKNIKSKKAYSIIPIIIYSGVMLSAQNLQQALETGAIDYIRKPIDPIELVARIKSALKISEAYQKILLQNNNKEKVFKIIGHDLRSPLSNLVSMLELIEADTDPTNDRQMQFIGWAKQSATLTYSRLNNLLLWVSTLQNTLPFQPAINDFAVIVNEAISSLSVHASSKHVYIHSEVTSPMQCYFDRLMISSVIGNLLSNAIKFTPETGRITIKAHYNNNDDFVYISVSDTGVGIPLSDMQTLFDQNSPRSTSGTHNESGTGLGLMLCKEFVTRHGGNISVESRIGIGSNFVFTIPANPISQ